MYYYKYKNSDALFPVNKVILINCRGLVLSLHDSFLILIIYYKKKCSCKENTFNV